MRKLFLKKMDKQTLDQIAETMPVLSEKEARACIGGGTGTEWDPCSMLEFERYSLSGTWDGYVDGGNGIVYRVQISEHDLHDSGPLDVTGSVYDSSIDPQFSGYRVDEPSGCFRRCVEMLNSIGIRPQGPDGNINLAIPTKDGRAGGGATSFGEGVAYINQELNAGRAVIVGVDYKAGASNSDKMTDHFVVITGRSTDGGYHFFDPATSDKNVGTSPQNLFRIEKDQMTGKFRRKQYRVTVVRRNY